MAFHQSTRGPSARGFRRGNGNFRPDTGNRHYVRGGSGFRGGARGGAGARATPVGFSPDADIKEGLDTSTIIETIPVPSRPPAPKRIPIENVKYVSSYNWINTEDPTIIVPGSPALWTGRSVPFTLKPDDGSNFVDQNTERLSEYPMLPLFIAADAIHGKEAPVDWPEVDVITDRNGLRKLLRWLGPSAGREVRDFRIDVDRVGTKTILLSRWESRLRDPPTVRTYGFSFEDAVTRAAPGCPRNGHHRAITYDMLDMKMVVRFEVDACLPPTDDDGPSNAAKSGTTSDVKCSKKKAPAEGSVDDLVDALGAINLSSSRSVPAPTTKPTSINVVRGGTQVPQDTLVEVTSRSTYFVGQLDWNEQYPQLVLSQTPVLFLGIHERGTFKELRGWRVDDDDNDDGSPGAVTGTDSDSGAIPDLFEQRKETAVQLVQLARLLEDLQELAISREPGPAGSFSLVCEGGKLCVYGRSNHGKDRLPPDVMARFVEGDDD